MFGLIYYSFYETMGIWYNRGHRMLVFHKLVSFFRIFMKCLQNNCAKIPQWLCIINTLFSLSKTVVFISVHVSLNNNELLLTPPLSTIFYAFGGALLRLSCSLLNPTTKHLHCLQDIAVATAARPHRQRTTG